jgi:hypothetical protein
LISVAIGLAAAATAVGTAVVPSADAATAWGDGVIASVDGAVAPCLPLGAQLRHPRGATIALWLIGVGRLPWAGLKPDAYLLNFRPEAIPVYPTKGVLLYAAITTLECIFVFVALFLSRRRPVLSPFIAMAILLLLSLAFATRLLHCPPWYGWHWIWLVASTFVFLLVTIGNAVVTLGRRLRPKST